MRPSAWAPAGQEMRPVLPSGASDIHPHSGTHGLACGEGAERPPGAVALS